MKHAFKIFLICLVSFAANAQKFGYIDSEYILNKMPEYKKALEAMDKLTEQWTKEVSVKSDEVAKLRVKYNQEEILLTQEMRAERVKEITKAEEDYKATNNAIFGLNGLLFQKKKEILKPILEEIHKISEKVARKHNLSFIFDKAADLNMFYANPKHDYTDFMLEELGIK